MRMEDFTLGEFVDNQVRIDHWGTLTFEAWVEEGRTEEGDMERMVREVGGESGVMTPWKIIGERVWEEGNHHLLSK